MFNELFKQAQNQLKKDLELFKKTGRKSEYLIKLEALTKMDIKEVANVKFN